MIDVSEPRKAPKVSLLLLTHDRYFMTKYCLENMLNKIGDSDYELLILDNGSKDERVLNYVLGLKVEEKAKIMESSDKLSPEAKELLLNSIEDYTKIKIFTNEENKGIAAGFNTLLRNATGEYICFLLNDVLVSDGWLKDLVFYNNQIDKSGLTSIHCEGPKGFFTSLLGHDDSPVDIWKCKNGQTTGISLIDREALKAVGAFDETLGLYGKEREQYGERLTLLGFQNYYIQGQSSVHLGREINDTSDYKKMKELEVQKNHNRYVESIREMKTNKNFNIEL